jgi:nitrogen fixation/metabolism regulation signal transduction histidine kinase
MARVQPGTQVAADNGARFRTWIETAVDGITTINDRGIVQACNPSCERLSGCEPNEVLGSNVNMPVPEPCRDKHDAYLDNCSNTGEEILTVSTYGSGEGLVRVLVADTGHGLTEEVRGKLLQPFVETKVKGMGLSICRSIVEAQSGRVSVGLSTDGGTIFRLSVPSE